MGEPKPPKINKAGHRHLSFMKRILIFIRLFWLNLFATTPVVDPDSPVDVTLTSHSDRIRRAFASIESIGRGARRPRRLILFLGNQYEQQPLPTTLQRLVRRGLEIRYVDDVGPHTKYYPYLQLSKRPETPLVTADDDKMYDRDWLNGLIHAYRAEPQMVNCWRAREVRIDAQGLRPYDEWPLCSDTRARLTHFATGVGGVIYPPALLQRLKEAGDVFKDCCPKADDLWLHVTAIRQGYPIRQIDRCAREYPGVPRSSRTALQRTNIDGKRNDVQAAQTYTAEDISLLRQAQ